MSKINAIITGVGGYVPDYVLNNEELSRMVDTNDEWITTRVGIKERRILTEEGLGTSYMARKAAKQLMQKTGADPDSIDAIIVATSTADYKFPSTASIVLGKLGLKNAFAFDFWAACCGFLYSLDVAASMIQSGRFKKIIVIGAEGNNKTEVLYFRELEKKQNRYHCIFAHGTETDPVNIVRNTIRKVREEELSFKDGDMAISIFDLDLDDAKRVQLKKAKDNAGKANVVIATSNPCFEVWYLEHFGYTSKPFASSNAVVRELEKKIPGYRKTICNFEILYSQTKEAISNCEQLDMYHAGNNATDEFANPRTDIYKVVKKFINEGGDKP